MRHVIVLAESSLFLRRTSLIPRMIGKTGENIRFQALNFSSLRVIGVATGRAEEALPSVVFWRWASVGSGSRKISIQSIVGVGKAKRFIRCFVDGYHSYLPCRSNQETGNQRRTIPII